MPLRAYEALLSRDWAILQSDLDRMVQIVQRAHEFDPQTVAQLRTSRGLDDTQGVVVMDDVAVVPLIGPMFRYGNLFSEVSGATSLEQTVNDFRRAIASPEVRAVLLKIDSPGGEASGVDDFASLVAASRGEKPIVAYVTGQGCSGAYWVASACDRIYLSPASTVGSIGVIAAYEDDSARQESRGVKTIRYVSSQSPNKAPKPGTESGDAVIQSRVDRLAHVFISHVATNRKMTAEEVAERFNHGGVLLGEDAVKAGAADGIAFFDQAVGIVHDLCQSPSPGMQLEMAEGNWFTNLFSRMTAQEREEARQALGGDASPAEPPSTTGPTLPTVDPNAALATVQQQLQEMRERQWLSDATNFFTEHLRGQFVTPGERAELLVQFLQAARDDHNHPISIQVEKDGPSLTRVELLRQATKKRMRHGLFHEVLGEADREQFASTLGVLPADRPSDMEAMISDADKDARAWAERNGPVRK